MKFGILCGLSVAVLLTGCEPAKMASTVSEVASSSVLPCSPEERVSTAMPLTVIRQPDQPCAWNEVPVANQILFNGAKSTGTVSVPASPVLAALINAHLMRTDWTETIATIVTSPVQLRQAGWTLHVAPGFLLFCSKGFYGTREITKAEYELIVANLPSEQREVSPASPFLSVPDGQLTGLFENLSPAPFAGAAQSPEEIARARVRVE